MKGLPGQQGLAGGGHPAKGPPGPSLSVLRLSVVPQEHAVLEAQHGLHLQLGNLATKQCNAAGKQL